MEKIFGAFSFLQNFLEEKKNFFQPYKKKFLQCFLHDIRLMTKKESNLLYNLI